MTDLAAIRHKLSDLKRQSNDLLQTMTGAQVDHPLPSPTAIHATAQPADISETQVAVVSEQQASHAVASGDTVDDATHAQPDYSAVAAAN